MRTVRMIALGAAALALAASGTVVGAAPAEAASCIISKNSSNNSAQSYCRPDVPESNTQHRVRVVCERGSAAFVYYGAWQPFNRYSTAFCGSGYTMIGATAQLR